MCVLQCDKSTALHFACTQGATEAVQAMLFPYKRRIEEIINIRDAANQTPLHRSGCNKLPVCSVISEGLVQNDSVQSPHEIPQCTATGQCPNHVCYIKINYLGITI